MDYFELSRNLLSQTTATEYVVLAPEKYEYKNFAWIQYYCKTQTLPAQGWKIHIAATNSNAYKILSAVFGVLIRNQVTFKHVGTSQQLIKLNHGDFGISQIGKFITIYPSSERSLINLLVELQQITSPFDAPTIFSDRSIGETSIVYYRYGGFISRKIQNKLGLYVESIIDPVTNEVIEDIRSLYAILPDNITDPVVESSLFCVEENRDIINSIIDNRYVIVNNISFTFKTRVYLALDINQDFEKCILKIANHGIEVAQNVSSYDLIQNESAILDLLTACMFAPKKRELSRYKDTYKLVTTYVEGVTLEQYIRLLQVNGVRLSNQKLNILALQLATIIQELHRRFIIHGDIKTSNILLSDTGRLYLVDYETAVHNPSNGYQHKLATRGFGTVTSRQSPFQQDIYAFASVLYSLITGHNPSNAVRSNSLQEIPLFVYHPTIHPGYEVLINTCWLNGYRTIEEVIDALPQTAIQLQVPLPLRIRMGKKRQLLYFQLSMQVREYLLATALQGDNGVMWESNHTYNAGVGRIDINIGAAGIILFLCQSYKHLPSAKAKDILLHACQYLMRAEKSSLLGLYVGEAGVRLAILQVALLLQEKALLTYCLTYCDDFVLDTAPACDLFNGLSGAGMYFLLLYQATKNVRALEKAEQIAGLILEHCIRVQDEVHWPTATTEKFLGFAHGIAGIGYFLIQLHAINKNDHYKQVCIDIHHTLSKYEKKVYKGHGLNWPNITEDNITSMFWCHGSTGIGKFYLALYEVLKEQIFLIKAEMAGRLAANFSAWLNVTQCHGIAGTIEYLLDLYEITGNEYWKKSINKLAVVLQMKSVIKDGCVLWPSEDPFILTPDYMVGFSGVASCLLRVSTRDFNLFSSRYLLSLRNYS
ncbi:hypothetical protein DNI29_22280 [Hymenobacter sediminis]|uniref:lanthionine synthetase LanC family protein n=1 Tax=Hymenobacter sediminis TaxID=2218621 RepID=UPI000DA6721D|nr:lanthionine synthetase LanC family protein [Hymenobacter sediminis]RPD44128.1 hypothetical protein DNI29_22280 [Hymenobacter sediminis]